MTKLLIGLITRDWFDGDKSLEVIEKPILWRWTRLWVWCQGVRTSSWSVSSTSQVVPQLRTLCGLWKRNVEYRLTCSRIACWSSTTGPWSVVGEIHSCNWFSCIVSGKEKNAMDKDWKREKRGRKQGERERNWNRKRIEEGRKIRRLL